MPIKIPNDLPAAKTLSNENIFIMTETRAITQDIRPLRILILNLMPKKIETETQLARLLGNTPLQVEPTLIHTSSHQSKNTAEEHSLAVFCIRLKQVVRHRVGDLDLSVLGGGGGFADDGFDHGGIDIGDDVLGDGTYDRGVEDVAPYV